MGAIRLASLSLEGFKSFAGQMELSFPGALIAIIGPNGAGKSNIADAIAWVLGEQSSRLLRSQNMAEVIFAGAPSRPALAAAQVSLTLAARDGRWAETEGRLAISRRVLRDGTSEYRLGGRRARLKDVLDQLMDAGLGTRAYAIIEQGRIGQVLSVRATERRALFEEAAGITKYRARRHEAELKLAETSTNLLRVADVSALVRRALDAARRQARRAQRHRELRTSLLEVRASLLAGRWQAAVAGVAVADHRYTEATLVETEASAVLATAESTLEEIRTGLDQYQATLDAARGELARVDALSQRREAEESAARREAMDAAEQQEVAGREAQLLASKTSVLATEDAGLTERVRLAEEALAARTAALAQAAVAAGATAAAASLAIAGAEEARRRLLAAVAAATEAKNRCHRNEVELEHANYQRTRLAAEQARLASHLAEAAAREETAAGDEMRLADEVSQIERERESLTSQHDAGAARSAALAAQRDRLGHELWQKRHESEGVERLLDRTRVVPDALVRRLPDGALLGAVADFLAPDNTVAPLLDLAYGELLSLPVCRGAEDAAPLAASGSPGEGRIEVVIVDRSIQPRPSSLLEQGGVAPEDLGWLASALPRAVVASTAQEGERLAASDPDLVVLLPGGGRRHGQRLELPGRKAASPGVLELRASARRLASELTTLARDERGVVAELEGVASQLASLAQRRTECDQTARTKAEMLAAAASSREALHRDRERLQRELEALQAEGGRLLGERHDLEQRLAELRIEAQRHDERAHGLEAEVDTLVHEADRHRDAAATARAEEERARGDAALAEERTAAARRELDRQREEQADLRRRETLAREAMANQARRAQASAQAAATARAELEELLARRSLGGRDVERLTAAVDGKRVAVEQAAAGADEARRAHLAARDASHAARVALVEAQGARDHLRDTVALTLAGEVELPERAPAPEEVAAIEAREQTLARELDELGPVNELAVAERDELETRHTFLQEQRRDLEHSLATLGETVKELDVTCASRFLATLEEANAAFDEMFRRLFGGGEARAELSDPEAPLESGIEIRVRCPGKHTQSVLLLSGGEKALAAIALLLALFRIRPAPFCLLDEVDAPLDDANVERLARLLREMSGDTQFLLITHNRRTMAHADVLYGVTMEEPGVSRVVSVRLED
jgi:chromosome segregation protein